MMGLITQFLTRPADRDALSGILVDASKDMPGCLSYVVALDTSRDDALWVTEVWTDAQHHLASLGLPKVREAMMSGRALITSVGQQATTRPLAEPDPAIADRQDPTRSS